MPFGAVLVCDGKIVASGRNRQVQDRQYFSHAELNCLGGIVQQPFAPDQDVFVVATEAPCPMCAGAIIVSGVRRVIVGEDVHYQGALEWLKAAGIDVQVIGHRGCIDLVAEFKNQHRDRWEMFSAG
ncbi:nucleoside deaminase [Paeniglutamicibacter kerguelensis]|uniref:nucleoside deaminase n=1 Tax=Paeniglutamicibacter kerguelensis TaxID=254788 RepID=UPI003607C218